MDIFGDVPMWQGYYERYPWEVHCAIVGIVKLLKEEISKIPAADVAPVVHGRWERSENESNDEAFSLTDEEAWYYWKCSVCHEDICYHDAPMGRSFLPKYCPNCGARCDL